MSVRGARGEDGLHKRKTNESPCVGSRAHYDGRGKQDPLRPLGEEVGRLKFLYPSLPSR